MLPRMSRIDVSLHNTNSDLTPCDTATKVVCFAVFFVLYHAVSQQQQLSNVSSSTEHGHRHLQQYKPPPLTPKSAAATHSTSQTKTGDPNLTRAQKAVRVAFYLWLSLLNLLATSTLWARAADAFDSNAAPRLFGCLGAGATLGERHVHVYKDFGCALARLTI